MLSRRGCVVALSLASLSPLILRAQSDDSFVRALQALDGRTPEDIASDETFWSLVRSRFEVASVTAVLKEHNLLVGRSDPYAGFFAIPSDRPRSLYYRQHGTFHRTRRRG